MAALFESMLLPFSIILGSIVFSIFGVFLFFAATGTTFSFMASIGIMILIGVVVNNGIVLVDHINNLRIAGVARSEAIVEAGRDRLRPILMTVATTIVGLTPLALGTTQVGGDGPRDYRRTRLLDRGLAAGRAGALRLLRQPGRLGQEGYANGTPTARRCAGLTHRSDPPDDHSRIEKPMPKR